MSGHSRQLKRCHNPDCYCTGDCIGMTQSAPAVLTERGRNSQVPKVAWPERLNSAVKADPHHVTWHRPEHRSNSIESYQELGQAWRPTAEVLEGMTRSCDDNQRDLMNMGSVGGWEDFGGQK